MNGGSISLSPIKSDTNIDYEKVINKNDGIYKKSEEIIK
jgi:hypothetical protein